MNILSAEQMVLQQSKLVKHGNAIKIQYEESDNINKHHHYILLDPSDYALHSLQSTKLITRNIRGLPINHPNASLKVFAFAILSLIYQEKFRDNENSDNSSYILQSLKCSLYSANLNLNSILNYPKSIKSTQIKAQLAHLFIYLDAKKKQFQVNKQKYLQWILHKNSFILDYLVIFFRCILSALEVEQALNWNVKLQDSEALIYLLDYFDINYRCAGDAILLYEEGLLIYLLQYEIIFGQYYENITDKQNDEKKEELKSSVKQNMVESFFMNDNHGNAFNREQENQKKKGIVASDMKLFNFILDSADEEFNMRESQMLTPHFTDGNDNFNFGKRKSIRENYHPEEIRFEFQKLIMDECDPSMQHEQSNDFLKVNKKERTDKIKEGILKILDDSIYEEQPEQNLINKNFIEIPKYRMSLENNHKQLNFQNATQHVSSSPQLSINQIGYNSLKNEQNSNHFDCSCFKNKLKKNMLIKKILQIKIQPLRRPSISPNSKSQQQLSINCDKSIKSMKNVNCPEDTVLNKKHIPSFLKKKKNQPNLQDFTKSGYTLDEIKSKKSVNSEQKCRNDQLLLNKLKHQSDFLENQMKPIAGPLAKPTKINYVCKSNNQLYEKHQDHKIEQQQEYLNFKRPKPIKLKTSTNCFDRNVKLKKDWSNNELNIMKSQNEKKNFNQNQNQMRYVAPINIIAPTVYMNSNGNDNHNRIVFMLEKNTYTPHNNQTTQRLNNLTANTFNDYNQTIKP